MHPRIVLWNWSLLGELVEKMEELVKFVPDAIIGPGEIKSVHVFYVGGRRPRSTISTLRSPRSSRLSGLVNSPSSVRTQLGQPALIEAAAGPVPKFSDILKDVRSRMEWARMLENQALFAAQHAFPAAVSVLGKRVLGPAPVSVPSSPPPPLRSAVYGAGDTGRALPQVAQR